jgi:hypothetical protein
MLIRKDGLNGKRERIIKERKRLRKRQLHKRK